MFNMKFSTPDSRDYRLTDFKLNTTEIPDEFIVKEIPEVRNQLNTSMCLAFTIASIKECQELKERKVRNIYSPAFIYAVRELDDHQGEGLSPREALKMLKQYGICELRDFDTMGSYPEVKAEYLKRKDELLPISYPQKVKSYIRLTNIKDVKLGLINHGALVSAYAIYDSFLQTGKDGIVKDIQQGEVFHGGHAMTLIGWKIINGREYFIVQNSWGNEWGDNGLCYIPTDYTGTMEHWSITDDLVGYDGITLTLQIGNGTIYVDNNGVKSKIYMDTVPIIDENDRTLLPIRFVLEALGYKVDWNGINKSIIIHK